MARTVAWPLRKTQRGGLALTPENDHGQAATRQLIVLGHLPGRSENPFDADEDVGFDDPCFGPGQTRVTSAATVHSRRFFARLASQGRATCREGYPRAERSNDETVVAIVYDDLEARQPGRAEVKNG